MPAETRTSIRPPRLVSIPAERAQLEYSSRSIVFAADGDRLYRAWGRPDAPWLLAVEPRRDRWAVHAWGADPPAARAAARAWFSLDHPLEEFYVLVRAEPVLRGTQRQFRGLRLPRDANLFEAVVHAVIGQQLSVVAANSIKRRLFAKYAPVLSAHGVYVPAVPPPSEFLRAGPDELRTVGLSRAKSGALVAIAGRAATLEDPGVWATGPLTPACERLEELPGVGRWTAENVLLRGVGRTDVFVAGDLGLRVALDRFGSMPRSAPEARVRRWAERWYPNWGSYATLYLWRRMVADRFAGADG